MGKIGKNLKEAEKKHSGAIHMSQREFDRLKKNTTDITMGLSPKDIKRIEKLEKRLEGFENRFKCVEAQSRETYADLKQRQRASQEE